MKKVFLVDANPLQINIWISYLRDSEWKLYTLKSLDDFGFRCRDFGPDIIVLGAGICEEEAAKLIKAEVSQIPVAVIGSAKTDDYDVMSFKTPFKPNEIELILNELLTKSKS